MKSINSVIVAALVFLFAADARGNTECNIEKIFLDEHYLPGKFLKNPNIKKPYLFGDSNISEFIEAAHQFGDALLDDNNSWKNWESAKRAIQTLKENTRARTGLASGYANNVPDSQNENMTLIDYMNLYYKDRLREDLACVDRIVSYESYSNLKIQRLKEYIAECENKNWYIDPKGDRIREYTEDNAFHFKDESIALISAYQLKYIDGPVYQRLLDRKKRIDRCLENFQKNIESTGLLEFELDNAKDCVNGQIESANKIIEELDLDRITSEKIGLIIKDIKTDASNLPAKAQEIIATHKAKKRKSAIKNILFLTALLSGAAFVLYKYIYSLKLKCKNCNSMQIKVVKRVELGKHYKYRRKDGARDQRYKNNPLIIQIQNHYICNECGHEWTNKVEEVSE